MGEKYLYPAFSCSPLFRCEHYDDYLLSDILFHSGLELSRIKMLYAHDDISVKAPEDVCAIRRSGCFVAAVVLADGRVLAFAPYRRNLSNVESNSVSPLYLFDDLVIRYQRNKDNDILRPVWVSALLGGVKYYSYGDIIRDADKMLTGSLDENYVFENGICRIVKTSMCVEAF